MSSVTTIRNIGPKMAIHFHNAGIATAEEVVGLGRKAAFAKIVATGMKPHFMAYIALSAGLEGRHWNDHSGDEKQELRAEYDQICAGAPRIAQSEIEQFWNEFGLIEPS